ncbi:formyltetrahydrofolate deformylase [Candidatus Erwinia haradaeae]|uniref:Formyltetrahydrofolate deformylase n=1 Tax=Candidatus Erwinia haradaeae TaxID=1922217 RepID=A0A451DAK2_9GAMM|nr:formyltetrahydrofolate deformylase [Candidatus Erwinia haradaeae]VFP83323.1 Formyltetrahydrofolate deformylase [Candidatus Erwinia haradaeae]
MQVALQQRKILKTICTDSTGLLSKITNIFHNHELNILENTEFVDHASSLFFMRTDLEGVFDENCFLKDLDVVLPENSRCELHFVGRHKIVILVSQEAHCLGDLLIKSAYGELDVDIAAVIGNHEKLRSLAERFEIPFIFLSHQGVTRLDQDRNIADSIDLYQPDYIVLAKYMRILTPEFVYRYQNKIINIHHSLLPAFIGAQPYHQAYERGVKIIGATAHYVSHKLDAGPIIMQDVIHIDHSYTVADMIRAGRHVEKNVLSRALHQVLTQRIFIHGNRTILL